MINIWSIDIYVLDTRRMVIMQSGVQTALSSRTRAVIIGDDKISDLLVNGYLRRYMDKGQYIIQDVIKIIIFISFS